MKRIILILLALTTVLTFGAEAKSRKKVTLAQLSDDGKHVEINAEVLKKTFPDGGAIKTFRVEQTKKGYQLLRIGQNAKGVKTIDAVPLRQVGNRLMFRKLKWLTTCFAPECDGFCRPDGDHCDCSGDSLSIDENIVLDPLGGFDVEQGTSPSSHNPGTSGGCTFGTVGGGLYDVVIING